MARKVHKVISLLTIIIISIIRSHRAETWEKPGCHKIGHTRKISIPDCVEFRITTNACRGYCESWAITSTDESLPFNRGQSITSIGQCCNIIDTEDITVHVLCLDGLRELTFKSAISCSCHHCKKQ
ncbi:thyrostimulin alpha-2 subunit [Planococcus citri]|uniref:thyrostimulin alpha-2 subunit n=1 Tax=Planococcus citri TaxID=170843 RepID=UPI0031F7D458